MALGNGTLPLESFKGYLVQDYLYLVGDQQPLSLDNLMLILVRQIHFARANALAGYKSKKMEDIASVCLGVLLAKASSMTDESRLLP